MSRPTFMRIAAAVGAIAGLAALLAPAEFATTFGVALDQVGRSQTRLLGAAYIGYAVIVWLSRDIRDMAVRRAIAVGNVVSWTLSLIVGVAGLIAGLAGTQAWALLVLELAFTAGWAYFAVIDRAEVRAG